MSAPGPQRTFANIDGRGKDLPVFDDLDLDCTARLAFEGTLVVVYLLVGLDAGKPHRGTTGGASWMLDFLM
jgi:hypothetical protein